MILFDLPDMDFDGYSFPSLSYEWNVTEEDVFGSEGVGFFAIYSNLPKRYDDLKETGDQFNAFNNNLNYLQYAPEIK